VRVLVTGASGCLGGVLLPALLADASIESVTAIDLRPGSHSHPRLRSLQIDIAAPQARAALPGHDAVIHLAYMVLRGRRTLAAMERVNVEASAGLLIAAARAGVRRQILLSSAAIYGNGEALDETAAPAPLPGFAYATHKAALERIVAAELPGCVRLRPHVILGAHAQPLLRWLLRRPLYPRLPAPEPRIQCVHETDVVAAIRLALHGDAAGAFNLAAPESFSYGEAVRRLHPHAAGIPLGWARAGLAAAWRLTGFGGEPRWIDGLARPLTLDCRRARGMLGWTATIPAAQALSEAAG